MVREESVSGTWSQIQVPSNSAPAARGGHSMVAMGNKMLVCGGTDRNLSECGNVLLFEMQGFTLLVIEDLVYSFGGQDPESGLCYNDVQRLDLAKNRWEKVEASSGRPAPRHAYCAGLVGSHSFAIFGGANQSNEVLSDAWVFNTRTTEWKHVKLEGEVPAGREMAAAASLPDSRLLVTGGRSAAGHILSDACLLDFAANTSVCVSNNALLSRCSHSAVLCEIPTGDGNRAQCCTVFGGFIGSGLSNDLVILKIPDGTCSISGNQDSTTAPAARFAHAACVMTTGFQQHMFVFGGMGEDVDHHDLMSWAPTSGVKNADLNTPF